VESVGFSPLLSEEGCLKGGVVIFLTTTPPFFRVLLLKKKERNPTLILLQKIFTSLLFMKSDAETMSFTIGKYDGFFVEFDE
jgi:hypothetical protein